MKKFALISILAFCLFVIGTHDDSYAAPEKGSKRCSDGIDNDGDGLTDISDPDCTEGDGSGGGGNPGDPAAVSLTITADVDGTETTIGPFVAVVECGTSFCEFDALIDPVTEFNLPESIAGEGGIIDGTFWHKTELDAELCYDVDGDGPGGLKLFNVDHIFMRVYDDPGEGFNFYVHGEACDMDSDIEGCSVRAYQKRFRGACDDVTGCAQLPPGEGESVYNGFYLNTWSSGPDSQLGIPCRCTSSNDPDCPDGTDLPPIRVTVSGS